MLSGLTEGHRMRLIVPVLAIVLGVAHPAPAQQSAPQRQASESDVDWGRRLSEFIYPRGRLDLAATAQRRAMLSAEDRRLAQDYLARVNSANSNCNAGDAAACDLRARLLGATPPAQQAAAAPPAPPVLTAEQQHAAATLRRLHAQLADLPVSAFAVRRTGDAPPFGAECREAAAAVALLGPPWRSPCPTGDQIAAHHRSVAANSRALERQRADEIAETERINSARAAARASAIASSGSGLLEVRTYDANGNYTGDRTMTRSQADTIGARPQ